MQVYTHCSSGSDPLLHTGLLQIVQVFGLSFSSLHRCSIGFRSGDWLGHSRTLNCFLRSHSLAALAVCLGSLSCWKTQPRPIFNALTEGRRLLASALTEGRRLLASALTEGRRLLPNALTEARRLLPSALTEARRLLPSALTEARRLLPSALTEARRLLPNALTEGRRLLLNALTEARRLLPNALTEARRLLPSALTEARRLLPNALTEARRLLPSALTEARRLLPNALTEARRLLPSALTEARRLLLNALTEGRRLLPNALTEARRLLLNALNEGSKISRCMAPSILPSIRCSRLVPFAEKHPQSMMFPPHASRLVWYSCDCAHPSSSSKHSSGVYTIKLYFGLIRPHDLLPHLLWIIQMVFRRALSKWTLRALQDFNP